MKITILTLFLSSNHVFQSTGALSTVRRSKIVDFKPKIYSKALCPKYDHPTIVEKLNEHSSEQKMEKEKRQMAQKKKKKRKKQTTKNRNKQTDNMYFLRFIILYHTFGLQRYKKKCICARKKLFYCYWLRFLL